MADTRDALMVARTSDGGTVRRPLSPFMIGSAYRPQLTSMLSISHRIAGVGLALGLLLMVWWLAAAASSEAAYASVSGFLRSPIGYLLLFGWTAALWYHFCNGIRHLAWDFGYGFELPAVHASGKAVLAATAVLTVLTWLVVAVTI
jgi:succinate dehydrogenase / fumarate reductase cytochrome b subunit